MGGDSVVQGHGVPKGVRGGVGGGGGGGTKGLLLEPILVGLVRAGVD